MATSLFFKLRQRCRSIFFCQPGPLPGGKSGGDSDPAGNYPIYASSSDIRRLLLLENAVVNYGGGLMNLQRRAAEMVPGLRESSPDAAALLDDIARYLRDVGEYVHLLSESRGKDGK